MTVRFVWHRIVAGDDTLLQSETPVTINEQLEQAVTSVAEFSVAQEDYSLAEGAEITISHVMLNSTDPDGYTERELYYGTINTIDAQSHPHSVKLRCIGILSRLRRTRDSDYVINGDKTDITAARAVLDYCGIPYSVGDIKGWGFTLGTVRPIVWKKGQSGAEFLNELDRVFQCATIEIGNGRVVRFPYSLVPSDYDLDDPDVGYGSRGAAKYFYRGQAGATFYDNNRVRGDADAIINYVRVRGLEYEGAEGSANEGCHYTIYAEDYDENPILGTGVKVGPEEFSSEFIQTEALAKAIAIRLMRQGNRTPDNLRIETANDPNVSCGDVVKVVDGVYGIALATETPYIVVSIRRTGDFMTLDCVGGPAGETGTTLGGIERCCGTQQEDGTCTQTGTNPSPTTPPSPGIPPDPGTGFCDPIDDPTCIPGVDYPIVEPPNVDDPFTDCTEEDPDELAGDSNNPLCAGGGGPVEGEWVDKSTVCWDMPWRTNGVEFSVPCAGGPIDKVAVNHFAGASADLTYNTTPNDCGAPGEEKTVSNDFVFGGGEPVCISGSAFFCSPGSLTVSLTDTGSSDEASIVFYGGGTGFTFDGVSYGIIASSENNGAIKVGHGPRNRSISLGERDNGGLAGFPGSLNTELSWSVCFGIGSSPQRVIFGGDFGGGFMQDELTIENLEGTAPGFPYDPVPPACAHAGHTLNVRLVSSSDEDGCHSWVRVAGLGHATCVENPDWTPVGSDAGL